MLKAALFLLASNVFMTFAWYGHLKFKGAPLWTVILVSWMIALPEYCLQVPGNRLGSIAGLSAAKLKVMQELITLVVFGLFSVFYLKESLKWNTLVGLCFVLIGVAFVFEPWKSS
jgi:uncharacterized protein